MSSRSTPLAAGATAQRSDSELFDPPCGVAVPGLASGALPEVLACLEATGRAAVALERAAGVVERTQNTDLCGRVGQRLARQPLAGDHERGFGVEVAQRAGGLAQTALAAGPWVLVLIVMFLPRGIAGIGQSVIAVWKRSGGRNGE